MGAHPPPPEMTCGFLIQLVFCQTMWFIGVEVEQEKSAPPPKKNPGSAPDAYTAISRNVFGKSVRDIAKGMIVDGFEFTVLQRNLEEWHERPWMYVCEC